MKDLAPDILRQRLIIEANYEVDLTKRMVEDFLRDLAKHLGMRIYTEPIVYSPGGEGKEINQGYDGFVALIDSGIAIYVWENMKFVSIVIYTCKKFKVGDALDFTKKFFKTTEMVHQEF